MTTWPAPLSRLPLPALIGKSHPTGKLDAVFSELFKPLANPIDLGFVAQTQCQTNWCWSAVATSVGLFYGTGNWTQCNIAAEQVNKLIRPEKVHDCCTTPSSTECNVDGSLYVSLQQVRSLDHWLPNKPKPSELYQYLSHNKELVCVRIVSNDIDADAHFTTIRACTDPSDGSEFMVSTSDTICGFAGSTLRYDDFPEKYYVSGTWADTYCTARRYVPAVPCGPADSAAVGTNNNNNCVSLRQRNGELSSIVGKIDRITKTISWGSETPLGKGNVGGIGLDDAGNCVANYAVGAQLLAPCPAVAPAGTCRALLARISSRHEHTTTISGRAANDPRQHARQRRAVARRVLLAVPPPGDPERRSVARSRISAIVWPTHGVHPVRNHRCRCPAELAGATGAGEPDRRAMAMSLNAEQRDRHGPGRRGSRPSRRLLIG
jgi:hypothetical protein